MPEYERRLERHERSIVLGNHPRSVISGWTGRWNTQSIQKTVGRADEPLIAIHDFADWGATILRLCVKFDLHEFGIEIVKKSLHLEEMLASLLFNCRGTKPQSGPMLCQAGLPIEQLSSEQTSVCGTSSEGSSS